jgi:hypothetical protein
MICRLSINGMTTTPRSSCTPRAAAGRSARARARGRARRRADLGRWPSAPNARRRTRTWARRTATRRSEPRPTRRRWIPRRATAAATTMVRPTSSCAVLRKRVSRQHFQWGVIGDGRWACLLTKKQSTHIINPLSVLHTKSAQARDMTSPVASVSCGRRRGERAVAGSSARRVGDIDLSDAEASALPAWPGPDRSQARRRQRVLVDTTGLACLASIADLLALKLGGLRQHALHTMVLV